MNFQEVQRAVQGLAVDALGGFSYRNIPLFLVSAVVCGLLAFLLEIIYVRYGRVLTNKKGFARNFIMLSFTTMFIISVVKTSLALSLGLVGALSIVRFRSAIKEPEELTYLFFAIAVGLGCGAGLVVLTILSFILFFIVIFIRYKTGSKKQEHSLYLNISVPSLAQITIHDIATVLEKYLVSAKLKRYDDVQGMLEASFVVDVSDYRNVDSLKLNLKQLHADIDFSLIDVNRDN